MPKPPDPFTLLCRSDLGIEPLREHRFHPVRKWRFDYAFPAHRVAVEIDGGIWTRGRHVRPQGYLRDMEKFNEAARLGWTVLKFSPRDMYTPAAMDTIRQTLLSHPPSNEGK